MVVHEFCRFKALITLERVNTTEWSKKNKNCLNRPFPSSKKSHFQNEAKCETFVVKMSFICIIIENHFHINGFALSLVLKVRFFGTRKWPISKTAMVGCCKLSLYANESCDEHAVYFRR